MSVLEWVLVIVLVWFAVGLVIALLIGHAFWRRSVRLGLAEPPPPTACRPETQAQRLMPTRAHIPREG